VASDLEVVQKSGSWFSYGELRLGQGKEKAVELLTTRPDLAEEIRRAVMDAISSGKPGAKPAWSTASDDDAFAGEPS
jgi:recombination protein RecA